MKSENEPEPTDERRIHDTFPDELDGDGLCASQAEVRAAQGGDSEALSLLLSRYRDRVHRIASIRMGARARAYMDSTDVVQETLLVASQNIEQLQVVSHGSVIRWLYAILENQILGAVAYSRAQKRDPQRAIAIEDLTSGEARGRGGPFEPATDSPGPAGNATRRELAEAMDAAVQGLEPDQREGILLHYYYQASWEEIAKALNRSVAASQQLVYRARAKLAPALGRLVQDD